MIDSINFNDSGNQIHHKDYRILRQDFSTAYNTKGSDKKWKQFSILQLNRFGNGEKIL